MTLRDFRWYGKRGRKVIGFHSGCWNGAIMVEESVFQIPVSVLHMSPSRDLEKLTISATLPLASEEGCHRRVKVFLSKCCSHNLSWCLSLCPLLLPHNIYPSYICLFKRIKLLLSLLTCLVLCVKLLSCCDAQHHRKRWISNTIQSQWHFFFLTNV